MKLSNLFCLRFFKRSEPPPATTEPEKEDMSSSSSTAPVTTEPTDPNLLYKNLSKPIDFTKPVDTTTLIKKNALVTGGANGLGEGFVRALAKAGAYVTIADWAEADGEKVAKELTAQGYK